MNKKVARMVLAGVLIFVLPGEGGYDPKRKATIRVPGGHVKIIFDAELSQHFHEMLEATEAHPGTDVHQDT